MSIWDKGKVLDAGVPLTDAFNASEPFVLYGMKVAGEADLQNGLPPATKTVLLIEAAAPDGKGGWQHLKEREVIVAGTFSQPVAEMASAAGPADFPVVVSWKKTMTKSEREATVLDFHGEWEGGECPDIPQEWNRF